MPPILELEVTDVSSASWEELAGQLDPDYSADSYIPTSCYYCDGSYDCGLSI